MHSPLEQFQIRTVIPLQLGGWDVSFTNSSLVMVLASVIIWGAGIWGTRVQENLIPTPFQSAVEQMLGFVEQLVIDTLGERKGFYPLIMSVFFFIFMGNVLGLVPGLFTFTSHIIVTFAMALFLFGLATALGVYQHGIMFFHRFMPKGVPLVITPLIVPVEIISYFFRPMSLAVRLFANMLAGHILLKIFAGFCVMLGITLGWGPMVFVSGFLAFEFFVAGLQAYIFTILTCVYIQDALEQH